MGLKSLVNMPVNRLEGLVTRPYRNWQTLVSKKSPFVVLLLFDVLGPQLAFLAVIQRMIEKKPQ